MTLDIKAPCQLNGKTAEWTAYTEPGKPVNSQGMLILNLQPDSLMHRLMNKFSAAGSDIKLVYKSEEQNKRGVGDMQAPID